MNLPADSLRFLQPLNRLARPSSAATAESRPPTVHCYAFSKAETPREQLQEARELLREALGWRPEVAVRTVRSVAPGKLMLCYTFGLAQGGGGGGGGE